MPGAPSDPQATAIPPHDDEASVDPLRDRSLPTLPGYTPLRRLGSGGQSVVLLATQNATGRRVAVKLLLDGKWCDERARERFNREVKVLATLTHPNIVSIIDRGRTPTGSDFLVLDYIRGEPLDAWLRQAQTSGEAGEAQPGQILTTFVKICEAVSAAHVRGIVHRDLKPANILIDERGEPHVLDFGLATSGLERLNRREGDTVVSITGEFLGSLPWASPEQAAGDPDQLDVRSDVYSLGIILYQMITGGRFPYEVAGNMRDVLNNIIEARPVPPTSLAGHLGGPSGTRLPSVPASIQLPLVNSAIEAIVLRALAKRPVDRQDSAGQLARDVRQYLQGRAISVKESSSPARATLAATARTAPVEAMPHERHSSSCTRRPRLVLVGCITAIVCAVVGGAIYLYRLEQAKGSLQHATYPIPETVP